MEPSWGHLEGFGRHLGASWEHLVAILKPYAQNIEKSLFFIVFSMVFGAPRWPLGASWGHLGGILGASWSILEASWGILEASWGILEASWSILEASWGILEAS